VPRTSPGATLEDSINSSKALREEEPAGFFEVLEPVFDGRGGIMIFYIIYSRHFCKFQ
jgi:hypothetical protein